jgi:hypothetical protein
LDLNVLNYCRYAFPIALSIDRPSRSVQSIGDGVEHGPVSSFFFTLTEKPRADERTLRLHPVAFKFVVLSLRMKIK